MKKIHIVISIILGLALIVGFYLWQYNPIYKDFGLNLFTEFIGIAFTVLIIELFFKYYNERHIKPSLVVSYMNILHIMNAIIELVELKLIEYGKAYIYGENDCLVIDIKDFSKSDLNNLFLMNEESEEYSKDEVDKIINRINEQKKLLSEIYNSRIMDHLGDIHNEIFLLIHKLNEIPNSREIFLGSEMNARLLIKVYLVGILEIIIKLQKYLYQKSNGCITYKKWQEKIMG